MNFRIFIPFCGWPLVRVLSTELAANVRIVRRGGTPLNDGLGFSRVFFLASDDARFIIGSSLALDAGLLTR